MMSTSSSADERAASDPPTRLYAVVLKFGLVVETTNPIDDPTYEIAIYPVLAGNEDAARRKGEAIGKAREHSYINVDGETVRDVFLSIADIVESMSPRLEDGCEVYYKLYGNEGFRLD